MAFRGKVDDGARLMPLQQATNQTAVRDISVNKFVTLRVRKAIEVTQVPGIRELVQIHDGSRIALHPLQDEVRPDEACTSRHQDRISHECRTRVYEGPLLGRIADRG